MSGSQGLDLVLLLILLAMPSRALLLSHFAGGFAQFLATSLGSEAPIFFSQQITWISSVHFSVLLSGVGKEQ